MPEKEGRESGAASVPANIHQERATAHMAAENQNNPAALLSALLPLHRDMGELQGRLKAVESRLLTNEVNVQDSFKIIEQKIDRNHTEIELKLDQRDKNLSDKLDQISTAVNALQIDDATQKGRIRGGITVISVIGTIGAAAGSLATIAVNWITHLR